MSHWNLNNSPSGMNSYDEDEKRVALSRESRHYSNSYSRGQTTPQIPNSSTPQNETRKDLLIYDLRKQVSELLRYKEQAANLRNQVSLLEEKEKIRESETIVHRGNFFEVIFKTNQL